MGSESPSLIDDYLRVYTSYIALLRDNALIKASPAIGSATNLKITVAAASATATVTADEIIAGTALGATTYRRQASFSKTINLATVDVGGMDTGAALVSGWVAIYAAFNPLLSLSATNPMLIGKDATSAVQTEVYSGANMSAGYTASALVAIVPTNASRQIQICRMADRHTSYFSSFFLPRYLLFQALPQ